MSQQEKKEALLKQKLIHLTAARQAAAEGDWSEYDDQQYLVRMCERALAVA